MLGVGAEFDQNGIRCFPFNHLGHTNFKERFVPIMKRLLSDRRYAILKVVTAGHHRTFLFNFENRKCVDKYIAQFFY
ncbi:unnamed protein product [Strongylus vulgaris]|uniref:Uncharacterized protein n=1 Tax=Strongylus vulgaris TaxID=40348 RepID=A0A3P7IDA4_STRVU|nr:unnamed protein product [Strongylus vulgaris]